jgi:RND family efflux transporter MFP subunit
MTPASSRPTVKVTTVSRYDWPRVIRSQGSLVADEHAIIGTKVAGRIKATYVDLGSTVKRQDRLVSLDLEDFELRIQEAQAQLAEAMATIGLGPGDALEKLDPTKTPAVLVERALVEEARANLQRARQLASTKTITVAELERQIAAERVAKARYDAALNQVDQNIALTEVRRAALALAQQSLRDAVITAPFDGVVQQRHVAAGAYVQVGDPVFTLVRTDPLRFRSGVPERKAIDLALGQVARIYVDGQEVPLTSRITRISPSLDTSNRALIVEADLANPDRRLRAGLFAEAEIVVNPNDRALAIPTSAVMEFAGVQKVWLVEDGVAREQRIQTARRSAELVEIGSGLEVGQVVIRDHRQGRAGPVSALDETQEPSAVSHQLSADR